MIFQTIQRSPRAFPSEFQKSPGSATEHQKEMGTQGKGANNEKEADSGCANVAFESRSLWPGAPALPMSIRRRRELPLTSTRAARIR